MDTPFLGTAYVSRSTNLVDQRAINIYPEIVETKSGKEVGAFYGTPGKRLLVTVGTGPIRGQRVYNSVLYVVSGSGLYSLDTSYTATLRGSLSTSTGPVGMINNTTQLLITDGLKGYVWNFSTNTYTADVLAGVSVVPVTCAYQDGFGLVNDKDTETFWQSNLNDLTTWGPLNFSSADAQPDDVEALFDNNREVWLFGTNTTEIWINAGNPGFAFQRLQGVFLQKGIAAIASPRRVDTKIIWLGRGSEGNGVVYMNEGYQGRRVSTHAIEYAIQNYSDISDAWAYSYQREGHYFYVLNFPTGNATWVYDYTESAVAGFSVWHERAYFDNGALSRDIGNTSAFFNGLNIVGDYRNGNLYQLDLDYCYDNDMPIKRVRSWRALAKPTIDPVRFNQLTLDLQTGMGVPVDDDPVIALTWSDDGGHSWSNQKIADIGQLGQTSYQVHWQRLGQTRKQTGLDRVFEISTTAPVPIVWIGADLVAEKT